MKSHEVPVSRVGQERKGHQVELLEYSPRGKLTHQQIRLWGASSKMLWDGGLALRGITLNSFYSTKDHDGQSLK